MSAPASVSVVVLTYNEEENLRRCLESVRGWADKVFVIDGYSTDGTMEVAGAFGAEVLQTDLRKYGPIFNWGLAPADIRTDWTMRLDADETVTPRLRDLWLERRSGFPPAVTGVYVRRRIHFLGRWIRHGGCYPIWHLRLWRTGQATCRGHEGSPCRYRVGAPGSCRGGHPGRRRHRDGAALGRDAGSGHRSPRGNCIRSLGKCPRALQQRGRDRQHGARRRLEHSRRGLELGARGGNFSGVLYGIRHFVPRMLAKNEAGHIVNTASVMGLVAPGGGPYTVSKHGVVALSEMLYKDLKTRNANVSVSVLCPGWVDTRILDSARNRPAGLTPAEPAPVNPPARLRREAVHEFLKNGIPPAKIADLVVEAIRKDRFYIVPVQPDIEQALELRLEDLRLRRNPTILPLG